MSELVIKKTTTRPVEIEYVKYANYSDVHQIAQWVGRTENIEMNMREQGAPVRIEYLVPGPYGTTNTLEFKLGDYIIKDLDGRFRVYNDRGFRQYFEV